MLLFFVAIFFYSPLYIGGFWGYVELGAVALSRPPSPYIKAKKHYVETPVAFAIDPIPL